MLSFTGCQARCRPSYVRGAVHPRDKKLFLAVFVKIVFSVIFSFLVKIFLIFISRPRGVCMNQETPSYFTEYSSQEVAPGINPDPEWGAGDLRSRLFHADLS